MDKKTFALAKFKYSKGDLYVVDIIQEFDTFETASIFFTENAYADAGGGTFQESYEYKLIDIVNGELHYHDNGKISTVFD